MATPVGGGLLKGFGSFVGFTALDYMTAKMMGQDASLLSSVGWGLVSNFLAQSGALPTVMLLTTGPELISLIQDYASQQAARRQALKTPHRLGGQPVHTFQSMNLQEMGLRNIMSYRRAIGMSLGQEAAFFHR